MQGKVAKFFKSEDRKVALAFGAGQEAQSCKNRILEALGTLNLDLQSGQGSSFAHGETAWSVPWGHDRVAPTCPSVPEQPLSVTGNAARALMGVMMLVEC